MSSVTAGASPATSKSPRILACVLCQHRKIKCDRSFPCANCLKANVQCTPSTPAPPRKRRRPNQDLQERLARCEELLREYASEGKSEDNSSTPNHASSASPQQTPKPSEEPMPRWHKHGKLIHDEGGTRFIDSYVVSTIYDELRAMRDIIDDDEPTPEDDTSDSLTPDTNAGDLLLGGDTPQSPIATVDLHPEPAQMLRLWQVFLDRVNPLFKIIHVPTLQPHLVDATNRTENAVPRNIEALLFSIYNMAALALSEDECQALLRFSRDTAIQRFSTGIRMCLNQLKFLKNHDLHTLQALVLYLASLQGRYNRHAAWILNGIVVRIAQKMGLHRDGTSLGLPPFETEMKRRLWWQIVCMDGRYAFISGLGHALLPRVWDTQPPRNLNDADLHPSLAELPPDRDGPTEMVFVLFQNRITRFLADTPGFDPAFLFDEEGTRNHVDSPSKEKLGEYRAMVDAMSHELQDMAEKRCDPSAGPIHEFTAEFLSNIRGKIRTLIVPPEEKPGWGKTRTDHVFSLGVEGLDHHVRHYRIALKTGFLWYTQIQFHTELFVFLAAQLCQRPSGPLTDKAWEHIETLVSYSPELCDINASKTHMVLGTLLVKAWIAREEHFMMQVGLRLPTPPFIARLRGLVPPIKLESPSVPRIDKDSADIKPEAITDPTFDEYLGNYLDGDWDLFSSMNMGANTNAAFSHHNGGLMPSTHPSPNPTVNQMPPALAGIFGLPPTTEWSENGF